MKEVRKILYVKNFGQPILSEVERLMDLRSLGLDEVIFLQATKVEGWERKLAEYGLKSKNLLVDGFLAPAIVNDAQRVGASLIVAKLNRNEKRLLRGSLTKELLRASTLPVLILPEDFEASGSTQGGVFSHLVFATDWSVASEKALSFLLSLKTVIKALEIVHVIDKKLSVKEIRYLKEKLSETRTTLVEQGIDAESHIYAGKPSEEIMLAAKDYNATCIVMGTSGNSTLKGLFPRRYSHQVAEASVVPTLVVP